MYLLIVLIHFIETSLLQGNYEIVKDVYYNGIQCI